MAETKGTALSVAVCSKGRQRELRALSAKLRRMLDEAPLPDCKLIVVEDISEAGVAPPPVAEADSYIAVSEKGVGFGAIRQKAVDACEHELILFVDDDCIPADDWLLRMAAPFLDDEVVAVGGGILPQNGNAVAQAIALLGLPGGGLPRLIVAGAHESESELLSTGNLALRKRAVVEAGGFDIRHRFGGEDQQLVGRLAGRRLFLPAALVEHRNRETFGEVWCWFVRRGRGEYGINRLSGMERVDAMLHPWRWSWSWRLLLLAVVWGILGAGWALLLLAAYYAALSVKTYLGNSGSSPLPPVEARRRQCLNPAAVAIAPAVRLCMDFAREAGRITALLQDLRQR